MNRRPSRHDLPRAPVLTERAFAVLQDFFHLEAVGGGVLLIAAAIALLWANSPLAPGYHALWHAPLTIGIGDFVFSRPLHFWVNDVLMTVFFLVVGMEIRQELHDGALSGPGQAALPLAAAVGGVIVPALIYLVYPGASTDPMGQRGWAVPTATDIAFAVGVLALLGRTIPGNVRVFLLALAIIDDIIAVSIIALVYSAGLDYAGFAVSILGLALVLGLQRIGIGSAYAYVIPGAIIWLGVLMSGAHPALAGVVLGLMTPVASVLRVRSALHPWVTYGVMPLFALANAGVGVAAVDLSTVGAQGVMVGVALALVAGKPLGVVGVSWLVVKLGWCRLPPGVSWAGIWLIGLLAGIGFTMSIFIAMLAFADANLLGAAKLGVLLGSLVAALSGLGWGVIYARRLRARADRVEMR